MTKDELLNLARKLNLKGVSRLRKEDLAKRIIEKKSNKEIKKIISPPLWRKYRNSIFGWASVIGLVIALFEFLPKTTIENELKNSDTTIFKNLVFSSAQELRKNKDYIFQLNWHLKNPDCYKPIGKLNFDETKKLFNSHFPKILKYTYGEEKYLLQIVLQLEDSNASIKKIKNDKDLRRFDKAHDLTVDDITFLNGFLFWYLSGIGQEELTPTMNHTLGWDKMKDDFNSRIDTSKLHMKYLDYDDFGYVTSYSDYLGFID